jgi:Tfp pilus assembly protein PilV
VPGLKQAGRSVEKVSRRLTDTFVTFRTFFEHRAPRDDGFALIEVVISAMLVAIIIVALLTGLDAAGRATADERFHNEATVLAAQSQEALRSDPASSLDTIQLTPHVYTQTVGGETFTITEKVTFVNGSNGKTGCTASGGSEAKQSGNYLQITSAVTWPQLLAAKRTAVSQSSVITPPDGSSLEVDVTNGETTPLPVEGVTVIANEVQTTTSSAGCVLYASIPATTVSLEAFKVGYVTESGEYKVKAKEVSIAPNLTTHHEITLAAGGSVEAEFVYKGKAAEGDTFVAFNKQMGVSPEYEVGSTKITIPGNAEYEPLASTYAASAQTAISSSEYPKGNLFPLKSQWSAYAGDCLANSPETVTSGAVKSKPVTVVGGSTAKVTVPTSLVTLNVYTGSSPASQGTLETKEAFPIKITNESCKASVAVNATKSVYIHEQLVKAGHLEHKYQPFGSYELCLYNSGTSKTYTLSYKTNKEAEFIENIYLGAKSSSGGTTENGVTVRSSQSKC